ncbi:MAG: HNH endonuclease [Candidatus Harrisonbacteria bacterium]|nr:HNH endonuclease [Candidatus Harrisonbacteria bacterium]
MPNLQLNKLQLQQAQRLLDKIRAEINTLANNDSSAIFAFRRKIYKELMYDERSKPIERKRLKAKMYEKQKGICPICKKKLPKKGTDLDRYGAMGGYTEENVRLVHSACHRKDQKKKGFK